MIALETVAPVIEWQSLSPVLIVLGGACLGVIWEGVLPRRLRNPFQIVTLLAAIIGALTMLTLNFLHASLATDAATSVDPKVGLLAVGTLCSDGPSMAAWFALLVFGGLALLIFGDRQLNQGASAFASAAATTPGSDEEQLADTIGREHTEVYALGLFSLAGMMVFVAANDLITMFIALEVMSLPLYLLAAIARRKRLLSQEAALKYFLLGAFASAFFLFGAALIYGYSGSFQWAGIDSAISGGSTSGVAVVTFGDGILITGVALLAVGLLFKMGAVPFQSWVPDVYTGSPTPVTGWMAVGVKIAAILGMMRVFYVALGGIRWTWQPVIAVVAVLTMVVGVIMALAQTNIKRLLAYSAVSHAGFILTAVVGTQFYVGAGQLNAIGSVMFYLIGYGFATIAGFAIIMMVRRGSAEAWDLDDWAGIGVKNPVVGVLFAIVLLSFAGIPLTAGFIGKWAVFTSAWTGGYWWLAVVGIAFSLVAAYLYLKVLIKMFFAPPAEGVRVAKASPFVWIPVIISTIATLILGLLPGPVMQWLSTLEIFIR
ncbi:MAG: NADH-quinone oxidoreductase subunit NuoN [Propionibacteriaceae bacterium]|jgi:NADH-quinone oxidoreductase subunit N|nr:NADH-quinone oxidoreductase subunit NuoN [Propionibacteriaceae bacterium]